MVALLPLLALSPGYRQQFRLPDLSVPSGWGVNIHFTDPAPGEIDKIADAGFRWVRMDLAWSAVEHTKGSYDFSGYDRLMASLSKRAVRALFILDYGNDLYQKGSPTTPEARQGFTRFVAAAVRRYRGMGVIWETWNEPNIGFWSPRPNVEEYIALAKDVQATFRNVAPEEWQVGPGTSGFDWTFLQRCFEAGLLKQWDGVTVHPYRQTPPETVASDWSRLRGMIRKFAPGKNVTMMSGEWGYSDVWSGLNPTDQAAYVTRMYLTNLANGVPLSILYDWKNDGPDPKESEHHFGTVFSDLTPKPAYHAIQGISRALNGFKFHLELASKSGEEKVLIFRKGNEIRKVSYSTNPIGPGREPRVLSVTDPEMVNLLRRWRAVPHGQSVSDAEATEITQRAVEDAQRLGIQGAKIDYSLGNQQLGPGLVGMPYFRITSVHLGLGAEPTSFRIRIRLRNGQEAVQETFLHSIRPIAMTPTLGSEGFGVLIDGPEGPEISGEVVVKHGRDVRRTPFRFGIGDRQKLVRVPHVPEAWLAEGVALSIRRGAEIELALPTQSVVRLPNLVGQDKLPSLNYRIEFDGDGKVASQATPIAVASGLRVNYQMGTGWRFMMLRPDEAGRRPIEGKPLSLGMWIKGDASGDLLRMRFVDSAGQVFQPSGGPNGAIDWVGWKYVTFRLDGFGAGHWGGKDDGVVRGPIFIDTLVLIDSKAGGTKHGIEVRDPVLIRAVE